MKHIQEVIVVEGKHDTQALQKIFDCDTIETGGSGLDQKVLDRIKVAKKKRGIIIFTDPDAPGNRIRDLINKKVPGCKNAFIEKNKAKTQRKVGVEHGQEEAIIEALEHLVTYMEKPQEEITLDDFYELGLLGKKDSSYKRKIVGETFHVGYGNAKTMRHRLNCLQITKEEIEKVLTDETNRSSI